jgi:hypothetical protein
MKTLKLLTLILSLAFVGCKTTIAPDADPVVVRSQQALEISFAAVDKFLAWEHKNRTVVSPQVHETAELLRKDFPPVFRSALDLLSKYKVKRDFIAKQELDNVVFQVKHYVTQAQTVQ